MTRTLNAYRRSMQRGKTHTAQFRSLDTSAQASVPASIREVRHSDLVGASDVIRIEGVVLLEDLSAYGKPRRGDELAFDGRTFVLTEVFEIALKDEVVAYRFGASS